MSTEDRSPQGRGPQHTTHYDDCGCQSAALMARIAELEQRDSEFDKLHAVQVARVEILIGEKAAQAARIATLEAELAAAKELADSYRLAMDDSDHRGMGWMAHAATLREALREFTPGGVPHNGVACALREFAAERQRASGKWDGRSETLVQWAIAIEAALASTPAADLAAHDVEVLERAAKDFEASDDELTRLRASLAAAEEKLAEAEKHADALAEHMQSLQDAGYEFHAPDNCERVDALLAAHAARRAGTTAVEREESKR